MTKFISNYR